MDNDFLTELDNKLNEFNIKKYQYLFFDTKIFIPPAIFSTFPKAWLDIYQEQKLYHHDPIIHQAKATVKPFAWQQIIDDLALREQPFLKQAKQYGIVNGYTLAVNDPVGNTAILNLLCDDKLSIDIAFFERHRAELQMLLIDLYDFYLQEKKPFDYQRMQVYLSLSDRERKVLVLGAKGLKYKEIARRLDISERTVKFHIGKIIAKLNVDSAKSAFLRSKELNII